MSRRRNRYKSFQLLRDEIARGLKVKNAVLDGEIVVLDQQGRSVFNKMLFRRGDPMLYVFDLLWLNNRDLRTKPLIERKRMLRKLIRNQRSVSVCYLREHVEREGVKLFRAVCAKDVESVVAKRKAGIYQAGERWFKIRNRGYTQMAGRHELFDSFRPPKCAVQQHPTAKRKSI